MHNKRKQCKNRHWDRCDEWHLRTVDCVYLLCKYCRSNFTQLIYCLFYVQNELQTLCAATKGALVFTCSNGWIHFSHMFNLASRYHIDTACAVWKQSNSLFLIVISPGLWNRVHKMEMAAIGKFENSNGRHRIDFIALKSIGSCQLEWMPFSDFLLKIPD